jgi:hypothetical protein
VGTINLPGLKDLEGFFDEKDVVCIHPSVLLDGLQNKICRAQSAYSCQLN